MTATAQHAGVRGILAALPEAISLALLAALPAFINLASERIFEEEKSLLLRAAALLALPGVFVTWSAYGHRLRRDPILLGFAAFTVVLVIAASFGVAPRDAFAGAYVRRHGVATWIALGALFVVMCGVARSADGRGRLLNAVIIGSIWPCVYLLLQRAGVDPVEWIAPTAGFMPGTTFGNHVLFAGYLAAAIPVTSFRAWEVVNRSRRRGSAVVLLLALQIAALVASRSRGGLVGVAAGALVFGLVLTWTAIPRRALAGAVLAVAIATTLFAMVAAVRPASLVSRFDPTVGSARVRVLIWKGTVDAMRASGRHVWLGYGPESLQKVFQPYYTPEIGRLERIDAMPDRAHNETLDTFVSAGVIGVALQLLFFGAVLTGALRVADIRLRAALTASAVAHIVEIQFGIANVVTRLLLFCVAAIIVGERLRPATETQAALNVQRAPTGKRQRVLAQHDDRAARSRPAWSWLLASALAGAASPAIAVLPLHFGAITTGTRADFVSYLGHLSLATPLLYGSIFVATLLVAWSMRRSEPAPLRTSVTAVAAAIGVLAAIPVSITPSRADVVSQAAAGFEAQQQWTEAAIAYGEASRMQPRQSYYLAGLGRAHIQAALRDPAERDAQLQRARDALERARALDPWDPDHARHLAGLCRIEALNRDEPARGVALDEADRLYAEATGRAPGLTSLWVEWAYVDVDRRQLSSALEKLARAIALDDTRVDAWVLRGQVHALQHNPREALADFDAALARAPDNADAQRGRTEALAARTSPS